jgi:hypothetical protein
MNLNFNLERKMYIYSGNCRIGTVGQKTQLKDTNNDVLCVGDIVFIVYDDNAFSNSLTVVCSDEFTSYSDGSHIAKKCSIEHFIMGIASDTSGWQIVKVKDHKDVIDGEKWENFGFNYKIE